MNSVGVLEFRYSAMKRIQMYINLCLIVLFLHSVVFVVSAQSESRSLESLSSLVDRALKDIPQIELVPWQGKLAYRGIDWDGIFKRAQNNPALRGQLFKLVQGADQTVQESSKLYIRPMKFEDIQAEMVDSIALKAGKNRDQRALAMIDCTQTRFLLEKVVPLALAARYTGNASYLNKVIEILREVSKYQPFQRPGWSLGDPNRTLPPEGDGPNMATAWGMSAVVEILSILGDKVPFDLRNKLEANLRLEIIGIVKAWADKLPWYVQSRSAMSNQWTDPNVGMIKACLYLGDPELLPAYNFGVENIAATLKFSQGDGSFLEGLTYAQMSAGSMVSVLRSIQENGDKRFEKNPFLGNFWLWLLQMQMPGGFLVNCCDSNMGRFPKWAIESPLSSFVDAANASGDSQALSTLKFAFPEGDQSLTGIEYIDAISRKSPIESWPLPLFAFFPSQQLFVWRSCYESPRARQTAMGLWIKGGSLLERSHGHRDQGQVSLYFADKVILMDCGVPQDYGDADLETRFASAAGHNIMQVGEVKPRVVAVDAPLEIISANEKGGHVKIQLKNVYVSVNNCQREVKWDLLGQMIINDSVEWKQPVSNGAEVYRFHTGSQIPVVISGSKNEWKVVWSSATMWFKSEEPIQINQETWPDHVQEPFQHQVIVIRSEGSVQKMNLTTTVVVNAQTILNSN